MKRSKFICLCLIMAGFFSFSQNLTCPSDLVYMDGGNWIRVYDPSQPLGTTNPSTINIPTFGGGLTLMPNINGGSPSPTFYVVSGGNYWYWNGSTWVNTGHSAGSLSAVNLGGCAGKIYNLVGASGQVYVYDGTGPGTLLTTLAGFNGGGPYDLVTDCNCNFYALKTTNPQSLTMYNAAGVSQCTYTLSGMPNTSAGGGFAIIGDKIYVKNNTTVGFYVGTMVGGGVTFTAMPGFTGSPGDFASCPICPPSNLTATLSTPVGGALSSSVISCNNPTVSLTVSVSASPVSYFWTGPGIVGSATGSQVTVNAGGIYTVTASAPGCPPQQVTMTASVTSNTGVQAILNPTGNVCLKAGNLIPLSVTHASPSDLVFWSGPGVSGMTTDQVYVNTPGSYSVTVTNPANGCQVTATLIIQPTPTISMALSANTLCLNGYNGSPASITITPQGAQAYTLLTGNNFSTTAPNGPLMPVFPIPSQSNPVATATLIGSSGFCADTAYATFNILPNPVLSLSDPTVTICPGASKQIQVSGATSYAWSGGPGLDTYTGPVVVASPLSASVYSVVGTTGGCKSLTQSVPVIILPIPSVSVAPLSSTICLGALQTLTASGTGMSYSWTPPQGIVSGGTHSVVSVSPPANTVYTVIASLNTCTNAATATVMITQPPVLTISMSNQTICARNFNGSPTMITFTPSGATHYTLLPGAGVNVSWPNGPVMQVSSSSTSNITSPLVVTNTLIGVKGVCTVTVTNLVTILPNPELMISPPSASSCPGGSRGFVASGANTYTWLPMPNYTLTGHNSIVAKPSLTSFYSVIGSDNGCHSSTKNAVYIVLPVPEFSVSRSSPTVCAGSSFTMTAMGNATQYDWTPSAGLSIYSGSVAVATPANSQTYTVKGTLNTCTNLAVATISVVEIPQVLASASQPTICSYGSTQLKASGADAFVWFPNNDLNAPSGHLVTASPGESTTYTVHGYNGICTGSTTVRVNTVKRPDMNILAAENQVCEGSSLYISATGAHHYTWSPAGSFMVLGADSAIVAIPSANTNYTVVGATAAGPVLCYQQMSYSVSVVPMIQPGVSPDVTLCEGERATLSAFGGNSFSWTPSYGLNLTNASRVVANPKTTTIYTVHVSHNSHCGKTTTVMVTVYPKPEVYAGRDTTYNLNEPVFIEAKGTGTVSWISGEAIACSNCLFTQVYPTQNRCYVAEAVNEFGCSVTDDVCIEMTNDFTVFIPNTFTPNNDGKNDMFLVYGENISEVSMEIYDRWGMKLFESHDPYIGWDGRYRGEICQVGTYTYIIRYTGLDRKKYMRNGHVNIIK
jgi:gliding motility-associated-like protein